MPTMEAVVAYYSHKMAEYLGKYLLNGRAHAHVGLHSPSREPELFRADWIKPALGQDRLKTLMHSGQEDAVSRLFRAASKWLDHTDIRTLDCGAGLGGTSIHVADRYGLPVDALTIVPGQGDFIRAQAREVHLDHLVGVSIGDVFDPDSWWSGKAYPLVLSLDSFCQMGRKAELFKSLSRVQESGAVLAFGDHYVASKASSIAEYFDRYWVSDISTLRETITALIDAGYRIRYLRNRSYEQMPYWQLSIAYCQLPTPDRSELRRAETEDFHTAVLEAYKAGGMEYFQIVATKV